MGMFNWVECAMPLPETPEDVKLHRYGFQTKSLGEKLMDSYRITEDGTLEVKKFHLVKTGRWYTWDTSAGFLADAKVFVDPPAEEPEGAEGPYVEFERVDDGWHPVDFTGQFNFYGDSSDDWLEFVATVERGKVVKLERDHDREFRMRSWR